MRIGELAGRANVNIQTIRYYERRGILGEPHRTDSGHRVYDDEALRVLRFIKGAQSLGFTLAEVDELLGLRGTNAPRPRTRKLTEARIADIDTRIAQLQAMRGALSELLDHCLAGRPGACPILEAFEHDHSRCGTPRRVKGGRS
ncbi:MAG: MerR family transcriptional regulator [Candidatus Eisenbacteria bacterium]